MLPRQHRITKSTDFSLVTRRGSRTRRGCLLVYSKVPNGSQLMGCGLATDGETARVGLIVSRRVGNSVVRHRVSRVLRHQIMHRVSTLRPGTLLVIRALPGSGSRSNAAIAQDLNRCLDSLPAEILNPGLGGMHE